MMKTSRIDSDMGPLKAEATCLTSGGVWPVGRRPKEQHDYLANQMPAMLYGTAEFEQFTPSSA
jgi:hypothetical protein